MQRIIRKIGAAVVLIIAASLMWACRVPVVNEAYVPEVQPLASVTPVITSETTAAEVPAKIPTAAPELTEAPTATPELTEAPVTDSDLIPTQTPTEAFTATPTATPEPTETPTAAPTATPTATPEPTQSPEPIGEPSSCTVTRISLQDDMKYASFSEIRSGQAVLYTNTEGVHGDITVCVNAGHGTKGGANVKTYCHPDKTEKVSGGTTAKGSLKAVAVSSGMTFSDGTPEAKVTLSCALKLRDALISAGYSVLMIREGDDVQLDNVARTVLANTYADCHIALHWDSTESSKGAFYMSVPDIKSYRRMEPVASTWESSHRLGDALIEGLKNTGVKIYGSGKMAMDLTQTSYSSIPSIDIELGDKKSDHSDKELDKLVRGLMAGVDAFFAER